MKMLKTFYLSILDKLQKQGLAFLLLAAGIIYFHSQNSKLEAKIDQCNSNLIEIYQNQHKEFIQVLEDIAVHLNN